MLTLFPEILFLAPFAAVLIRLAVSCCFAYCILIHLRSSDLAVRILGLFELAATLSLFVGFYTQLGALLGILLAITYLTSRATHTLPRSTAALLLVLCVSLLITGPGPLAFDLPL